MIQSKPPLFSEKSGGFAALGELFEAFKLGFIGEDALGTLLKKCPQTPSKLLGQRIDIQRVKFADQGEVRPLPRSQASGAAKTLPLRPHERMMEEWFGQQRRMYRL